MVVRMDTKGTIVIAVSCRTSNNCEEYSAVTLILGVLTRDSQGETLSKLEVKIGLFNKRKQC